MDDYKITYEDGTETILQLDEEDVERWQDEAKSKTSPVKSVSKGSATPINKGGGGN